jgi:GNAT superfamily N-acetyltransferase
MSLQIRAASAADIEAMHRIRIAVRENRLIDPRSITETAYSAYVENHSAWVAEDGRQMLGFAAVDGTAGRIWALFVTPDAEGSGVGRALHEAMLNWAKAEALRELWLTTSEGTRAERFYLRAGWAKSGFTDDGELLLRRSISV